MKTPKRTETLPIKQQDRNLKAPQSIIHIKHRITLRQYKYWILMLVVYREAYKLNQETDAKGFYRFPISRITEYIGYEPVKEELKADFEALRQEPIMINMLNKDGKPVQRGMGFISEWEITSKTVGFKLPSFLEEVMRGLDEPRNIFHMLNWNIFNHFSGKYEAVIYKLCRDYVGIRQTPYMTIQEYREYMGLEENEYKPFDDLNKRCITGPCKTINASSISDVTVAPDIDRRGRKAVGLRFFVEPKDQATVSFINAKVEQEPHPAFLQAKVPVLPKQQEKYLALRTAEEIEPCIARANEYGEQQERAGKPPNYGALYRAAIEEGWHVGWADKKAAEEAEKAKKKAEAAAKRREAAAQKARAEEGVAQREAFVEQFKALPGARQQALIAAFLDTADAQTRAAYTRKGLDSPFFLFPFLAFLQRIGWPA